MCACVIPARTHRSVGSILAEERYFFSFASPLIANRLALKIKTIGASMKKYRLLDAKVGRFLLSQILVNLKIDALSTRIGANTLDNISVSWG